MTYPDRVPGSTMDLSTYRTQAQRWWARDWNRLSRRDRRRLMRTPRLWADHVDWNAERERRYLWALNERLKAIYRRPVAEMIPHVPHLPGLFWRQAPVGSLGVLFPLEAD